MQTNQIWYSGVAPNTKHNIIQQRKTIVSISMHNQYEPSQYLFASTCIPSVPHDPQLAVAMLNQGLTAYEHMGQATAVSPSEEQRNSHEISVPDPGKYKYHRQLLVLSKQLSSGTAWSLYQTHPPPMANRWYQLSMWMLTWTVIKAMRISLYEHAESWV